jgi:hypothetical protein
MIRVVHPGSRTLYPPRIPDPGVKKTLDPVPEFIDPVFVKTSPKRSFLVIENTRFGLVLPKTGSINSGTGVKRAPDPGVKKAPDHGSGSATLL